MRYSSDCEENTELLGTLLAQQLRPGDVIAFTGDLGAGKTAFTRGIARGLGITERVTSPTFTIVNEYLSGRLPLFHFDLYRLSGCEALYEIGWDDYLERGGVCVAEWSENCAEAFKDAIRVAVSRSDENETARWITVSGGRELEPFGI